MRTRDRLVATASALFRRQGYNATGLNQILAESAAPKGSLYHHFPGGKEQLAAESVALSGLAVGGEMTHVLDACADAPSALAALGEFLAGNLERSDYRDGCPVATVALEAASDDDAIRSACGGVYAVWLAGIRARLVDWGVAAADAERLAGLVLSSVQGALLLARVQRDVTIIHDVCRQVGAVVATTIINGAANHS